ncbi:MAG: hypothetical protein DMG57_37260 [Acidobacteria bacterium]|nr:MAG: hypothetical protein DMG57_37260 [Acidobacteriota bacterium]
MSGILGNHMFCSSCGKQIDSSGKFCLNCGAPLAGASGQTRKHVSPLAVVFIVLLAVGFFGVVATMAIIGGVAIPNLRRAQVRSQEVTTIQNIRLIHMAQAQYENHYGGYATSLAQLVPLIPKDLGAGFKNGYRFTLRGGPKEYTVHAEPVSFGKTGTRTYYSDQTLVIREHPGAARATSVSTPLP